MNWVRLEELAHTRYHDAMDPNGGMIFVAGADTAAVGELVGHCAAEIGRVGGKTRVSAAGSFGYDVLEPIVAVRQGGRPAKLFVNMTSDAAVALAREAAHGRQVSVDSAPRGPGEAGIDGTAAADRPLFGLQRRIVLRNCGLSDPEDLFAYVALDRGYGALARVLEAEPQQVIEQLAAAGVRGRGGSGFPAAQKWRLCRETPAAEKVIICNAVDGDPKARTARLLLGGDPHSVLEGLLIGAYAVGAARCIIAVDREERTALSRLAHALAQLREYGLSGDNILATGFRTEIDVVPVAASMVAGEQTALLRSLQGRQAMPYVRTTHGAVQGLADQPTVMHHIETLAQVTAAFRNPAAGAADAGASLSKGTKVVTVVIPTTGSITIEVPFGTTLGRIVEATGSAFAGAPVVKAVQVGGPSGTYFAGAGLDTPLDYETLASAGAFLGSGTMEVIAEGTCAVAAARNATAFLQSQSCGKCVFCREGSLQLADILESIAANTGRARDLELIQELGEQMKSGCICGLGRTAALPALSSLALFRPEYEVHIREKRCLTEVVH